MNQPERVTRKAHARKKAPFPELMTAEEAAQRLRMDKTRFRYLVRTGKIQRVVLHEGGNGYYKKEEIFALGDRNTLTALRAGIQLEPPVFRTATLDDFPGMFQVVVSLWGANVATPVKKRESWYQKNSRMDYVLTVQDFVIGYISINPFIPDTLEQLMSGAKRGLNLVSSDFLPFEPGGRYDCFIGINVRQDVPHQGRGKEQGYHGEHYSAHLIRGFQRVLKQFIIEDILIRKLLAVSDQKQGIAIANELGFERESAQSGDLFFCYGLDFRTSNSPYAIEYRQWMKEAGKSW
jgi:muconolactone delta-isomerase